MVVVVWGEEKGGGERGRGRARFMRQTLNDEQNWIRNLSRFLCSKKKQHKEINKRNKRKKEKERTSSEKLFFNTTKKRL